MATPRRSTLAAKLDAMDSSVFKLGKSEIFDLVDNDGDGVLTRDDFDKLHYVITEQVAAEQRKMLASQQAMARTRRKARTLLILLGVLLSFLVISVLSNYALVYLAVDANTKTTIDSASSSLETKDGSGRVVKTAVAKETLPLFVAPMLPLENLFAISSTAVTYKDHTGIVEAELTIAEVRKHNNTYVELVTALPGRSLQILNGEATIVQKPDASDEFGETEYFPVCSSNVTCSSFSVKGVDAEEVQAQATAELAKIGVKVEEGRHLFELRCYYFNWFAGYWATNSGSDEFATWRTRRFTGYYGTRDVVIFFHPYSEDYTWFYAERGQLEGTAYVHFLYVYPTSPHLRWSATVWQDYSDGDYYGSWESNPASYDTMGGANARDWIASKMGSSTYKIYAASRIFAVGGSDGANMAINFAQNQHAKEACTMSGFVHCVSYQTSRCVAYYGALPAGDVKLRIGFAVDDMLYVGDAAIGMHFTHYGIAGWPTSPSSSTSFAINGHNVASDIWLSGGNKVVRDLNHDTLDNSQSLENLITPCPGHDYCSHVNFMEPVNFAMGYVKKCLGGYIADYGSQSSNPPVTKKKEAKDFGKDDGKAKKEAPRKDASPKYTTNRYSNRLVSTKELRVSSSRVEFKKF